MSGGTCWHCYRKGEGSREGGKDKVIRKGEGETFGKVAAPLAHVCLFIMRADSITRMKFESIGVKPYIYTLTHISI